MAVIVLAMFSGGKLSCSIPNEFAVSNDVVDAYLETALHTVKEVSIALGLIVVFFLICQFTFLHMNKRQLKRIAVGVVFTYIGLVMFLTGVNE